MIYVLSLFRSLLIFVPCSSSSIFIFFFLFSFRSKFADTLFSRKCSCFFIKSVIFWFPSFLYSLPSKNNYSFSAALMLLSSYSCESPCPTLSRLFRCELSLEVHTSSNWILSFFHFSHPLFPEMIFSSSLCWCDLKFLWDSSTQKLLCWWLIVVDKNEEEDSSVIIFSTRYYPFYYKQ